MADLQNITPVYYDSETKTHKPMGEGQVVDPKLIALSADAANILETHDDGLYVPTPAAPEPVTAQDLLSADKPNYLRLGNDGKLKVDGNDVLSNGAANLLTINPVDYKVELSEASLRGTLRIVSSDKGNVIVEGSDKGAYLSLDDLVASDNGILYKDADGKLNAGLTLGYDGLTGRLSLFGHEGDNELSSITVVAAGSMLIGAEFIHGKPDSTYGTTEGTGDYHISLSASYNGVYDGGVGLVFKNLKKGLSGQSSFTYDLYDPTHSGKWPDGWEAFFNGNSQTQETSNSQTPLSVTFEDNSTLTINSWSQEGMTIKGNATFVAGVGIRGGYFLHMIFRLASGVITDTYLDFTDIVEFYAGCGITIDSKSQPGKRIIAVVTSETGGIQCTDGALALKLNASGGLQSDENGLSVKVNEGNGLLVDESGVKGDPEWVQGLVTGVIAGMNITIVSSQEGNIITAGESDKGAYLKVKENGGLTASEDGTGLGVDTDWLKKNALTDENIKAGDGIAVSVEEGSATVSAKLKATNPGLDASADGLSVLLSESGGLTSTAFGLAVNLRGDGALSCSEGGLGVKTKPAGGLDISGDGIGINEEWLKQHAITEDTVKAGNGIDVQVTEDGSATVSAKVQESGGLEATAGGLAVKPATNGGLESTENGLGVKTDTNGGLESTEEGLKVKTNTDGGLQSTEAGLGIDEGWLKEHAITSDTIKAGNGIEVSVVEGAATITAKPKDNGGISVDESGIALKVKPDASLTVDAEGLSITTADGDSPQDTDVVTYGWLKDHLTKVLSGLIADNSALTVGEDGKLNVTIVSADTGNLLGLGKDKGAYMHGDLNKGPNSDAYEG